MNFLAHLYLSGDDEQIKFGNFIADAIKNSDFDKLPEKIQKGIILHRQIDEFTDKNEIFLSCAALFRPAYRLFSKAVTDILFDYFLAKNWKRFSDKDFRSFVDETYSLLLKYKSLVPDKYRPYVETFIQNDRLGSYQDLKNLKIVLDKMSTYRGLPNAIEQFEKIVADNYNFLEKHFFVFFEQLTNFVKCNYPEL